MQTRFLDEDPGASVHEAAHTVVGRIGLNCGDAEIRANGYGHATVLQAAAVGSMRGPELARDEHGGGPGRLRRLVGIDGDE